MNRRTAARLAWSLCGLALGFVAAAAVLLMLGPHRALPELYTPRVEQLWLLLSVLGPPVVGGLVAARRPGNPYGWLALALALALTFRAFSEAYVTFAVAVRPGSLPFATAMVWLGAYAFMVGIALASVVLLVFPTGRPSSWRGRALVRVVAATAAVTVVAVTFTPLPDSPVGNPIAVSGMAGAVLEGIVNAGVAVLFLAGPVAALSVLARFRRARGVERQQLKWFALAAALIGVFILTDLVSLQAPEPIDALLEIVTLNAPFVAMGVAILRYRLYDIDRIINRTLVYGLLSAVLAAGYALVALVLAQLAGQGRSSLAVAGATLAVAAAFQPLRRRIQAAVDRRFNRRRYDAAMTISAFSNRLRDQVDLETLSAELLSVVDATVEPTRASLWLRPAQTTRR